MLPAGEAERSATLLALQVTTRSMLGAVAYNCGGILVGGGWLRILGARSERMTRGLLEWNRIGGEHRLPGAVLVADDVMGGFYAINGGGLPGSLSNVHFLPPDSLEWVDMECGHTDWLHWVLAGDLDTNYESLRWTGWQEETAAATPDQCFCVYPPLWAEGPPLAERARKLVPLEETWRLHAGGPH